MTPNPHHPASLLLLATALVAPCLAQQTRVLPGGMDVVEGPSVYTYPFGRVDGSIQLLYDASTLTLGQGVILGMRFRQSQVTAAQTHPGYTKNYQVTAYTVPTPAALMVADPAVNIGAATGTVVFNGPLTLPPVNPLATQPADFGIHIQFTQPYLFDGSQGNLLLLLDTADMNSVPSGSYRIDAVNFVFSQTTGLSSNIDTAGCFVNGRSLSLAVPAASAIVGGTLQQDLTASGAGGFPIVLAGLSLGAQPMDLAPLGMPGCTSWLAPFQFQLAAQQAGGTYPSVSWSLPNNPWIEGVALVSQALGIDASGALANSAVSNAVGTRIGGSAGPTRNMGMSFRSSAGWAMGTNGVFMAVVALEGVFP